MDGKSLSQTGPLEIKVGDLFIDEAFNLCVFVQRIHIWEEHPSWNKGHLVEHEDIHCLITGKEKAKMEMWSRTDIMIKLLLRPKSFRYIPKK